MKNLEAFEKFGKTGKAITRLTANKKAVIYTRVSSKEQADKNLSLSTQKRIIEDAAKRDGYKIFAEFGGTYESAKTDGRKEFNRCLTLLKRARKTLVTS